MIRQQSGLYDEDKVIVVEMAKVDDLVRAICERTDTEKPAKDRTAAARQKRYRARHRNGVTPVTGNGMNGEGARA